MIGIKLNGIFLDLDPKTAININLIDPIFDPERIARTFSYPFKLKLSPKNITALSFAHRLDSALRKRKYDAQLYLQGQFFEQGILRILKVSNKSMEVAFQNETLDIIDQMKTIKLRNLSLNVPVNDYRPPVLIRIPFENIVGQTHILLIEVNGILFEQDADNADAIVLQIQTQFPGLVTNLSSPEIVVMEFDTSIDPNLRINLQPSPLTPADEHHYGLLDIQNTLAEQDHQNAWKLHLNNIQLNPTSHVFPTFHAPDLYDEANEEYLGVVNATNQASGDYYQNQLILSAAQWTYTLIPMPFLSFTLSQLFSRVGALVDGDFHEDADLQKIIVYSNRTIDFNITPQNFIVDQGDSQAASSWNGFPENYNLADQYPDITLYEFVIALQTIIPFVIQFIGGKVFLKTINSLLDQQAIDYSTKVEPSYSLDVPPYGEFSLDYERQDEAPLADNQLEAILPNENADDVLEFTSSFFSLYTRRTAFLTRSYSVPLTKDKGYSLMAGIDEPTPLKLLLYHGLQNDASGSSYPFASHANIGHGFQKLGNLSLDFKGEDGLYQNYWQKYIDLLLNGEPIAMKARLSIIDILHIRNTPGLKVFIQHPKGSFNAIIKKVQFKASLQSISLSNIELVKI
jgi:hypothetical protein